MKANITTKLLSQLIPGGKPYDVRDEKLKGFLVRVNISGKLVYMCEYARAKRIIIGRADVMTPAQARDRALIILGDITKGIDPRNKNKQCNITLNDFIINHYAPWFSTHRKSANKTIAHIKRCFAKPFGDKPLNEISSSQLDQWRMQRLKNGKSIETVNRDVAVLKSALSKALLWDFLDQHPLAKFKLLKTDRRNKVRYLSCEEEKRLREAALERETQIKKSRETGNIWRLERNYPLLPNITPFYFADHIRPMILISINTGLRRGEVFNLSWDNIDLDKAILTIDGSNAKSGKTRHVPLNSEALYVLKQWKLQAHSSHLVFPNHFNKPFDNVKKAWTNILLAADIRNLRWHDLRHHFASKLVMAGVDLNTVRELLGHSDMSMTLRYAHLAPEHKAKAVEKLVNNQN